MAVGVNERIKVALVGAGQMGEALLKGMLDSGILNPKQIVISDVRKERLKSLQNNYKVSLASNNLKASQDATVIIIAVKPQQIEGALKEIKSSLTKEKLLISIAAGVSTRYITKIIEEETPVVRVMPNTPALVTASVSAISPGKYARKTHLELTKKLFLGVGKVVVLEEKYQNAVTALSGSGPAYFFLFIEALIEAGLRIGLSQDIARTLATETMFGSAKMLKNTSAHPAELRNMVTSPGGTTIAGLEALESAGLRAGVFKAVRKAWKQAQKLGNKHY